MLLTKDCAHLQASDWAEIFNRIIKRDNGEKLLLAISDGHEGGVTSHMPAVRPLFAGLARHADIVLLNGDDFEYESPADFTKKMQEIKQKKFASKDAYNQALLKAAEDLLHQKVEQDITMLTQMIEEDPTRQIVKVIGNHENFTTFRDALSALAETHSNFRWTPEVAIIPMPGGDKKEGDRLLATHGDLQMDDLWFVEPGGTDRERQIFTHKEMAAKVVAIASSALAPSAQKQEKFQGIVDWWRKPSATAKTLFAELLLRAQRGDMAQALKKSEIDMNVIDLTIKKLGKRKTKFAELVKGSTTEQEHTVNQRAMEEINQQIKELETEKAALDKTSNELFLHKLAPSSRNGLLHYIKPGEHNGPKLLTSDRLKRITHINYGHTHVATTAEAIGGFDDRKIIVSNNASVTGATMGKQRDTEGNIVSSIATDNTELGNLGLLLYRVNDGKVTGIKNVGELIVENIHLVRQLIRDVPTPQPRLVSGA